MCLSYIVDIPVTIYLPCLKKLSLINVLFSAPQAFCTLLSGCPLLEELVIENIIIEFDLVDIHLTHIYGFRGYPRLEINAPALGYLKLRNIPSVHISAQKLAYLTEADICIASFQVEQDDSYFFLLLNFVDSLYNVKYLKLSSGVMVSVTLYSTF